MKRLIGKIAKIALMVIILTSASAEVNYLQKGNDYYYYAGKDWTADETYIHLNMNSNAILIRQGIQGQGYYLVYSNPDDYIANMTKAILILNNLSEFGENKEKVTTHPSWFLSEEKDGERDEKGDYHFYNAEVDVPLNY